MREKRTISESITKDMLNSMSKEYVEDLLENVLIVCKDKFCETSIKVSNYLHKKGIIFTMKSRENISKKDFKKDSFVIVVGGDGTLLKTAQFIENNSLIIGINSDPMLTEGYLTSTTIDKFEKKLDDFFKANIFYTDLPRLKASINDREINIFAINEVSISKEEPYKMLLYDLFGNVEKATGIIVSTPVGSTAWALSAGGKSMPLSSDKLQFVIREPYTGKIYTPKKKQNFVNEFSFKAISEGIIVMDSVSRKHKFKKNNIIKVMRSDNSIRLVV